MADGEASTQWETRGHGTSHVWAELSCTQRDLSPPVSVTRNWNQELFISEIFHSISGAMVGPGRLEMRKQNWDGSLLRNEAAVALTPAPALWCERLCLQASDGPGAGLTCELFPEVQVLCFVLTRVVLILSKAPKCRTQPRWRVFLNCRPGCCQVEAPCTRGCGPQLDGGPLGAGPAAGRLPR